MFFCITIFVIFFSCTKQNELSETAESKSNVIEGWLTNKIQNSNTIAASFAQDIKNNLNYKNSWTTNFSDNQKLIIIALNTNLKLKNNKDESLTNYLVLTVDENKKISSGDLWQVFTGSKMDKKTIANIYLGNQESLNGTYVRLYIKDNFKSKYIYNNNKLTDHFQRKIKVSKQSNTSRSVSNSSTTSNCTDYYVLHTNYNTSTGEIISQSVLYTFEICNCNSTDIVQSTIIAVDPCDIATTLGGGDNSLSDADIQAGIAELQSGSVYSETTNMVHVILTNALHTETINFGSGYGPFWTNIGSVNITTSVSADNKINVEPIPSPVSYFSKSLPNATELMYLISYADGVNPSTFTNQNNTLHPNSSVINKGTITFGVKIPGLSSFDVQKPVTGTLLLTYKKW